MAGRKPRVKTQEEIIELLNYVKIPLTTTKIANILKISWNTAEKYCRELEKQGKLKEEKRGKNSYWNIL